MLGLFSKPAPVLLVSGNGWMKKKKKGGKNGGKNGVGVMVGVGIGKKGGRGNPLGGKKEAHNPPCHPLQRKRGGRACRLASQNLCLQPSAFASLHALLTHLYNQGIGGYLFAKAARRAFCLFAKVLLVSLLQRVGCSPFDKGQCTVAFCKAVKKDFFVEVNQGPEMAQKLQVESKKR